MPHIAGKCDICTKGKAKLIWQPFASLFYLATYSNDSMSKGLIAICEGCKSRIYKSLRSYSDRYKGFTCIDAFVIQIRKEFKL